MFVRLFVKISWLGSIHIRDFYTLCGVPLEEDSYWSRKRRYAAATEIPANRKQARVFSLNVTSVPYRKIFNPLPAIP